MKILLSLLAITTGTTFITAVASHLCLSGNMISSSMMQEKLNSIAVDLVNLNHVHGCNLQADFICDRIENAFNGNVACECSIRWTTLQVDFQCAYIQPACTPETPAGTFCSQPRYSGKLTLRPLRASATLENTVCTENVTLTDSPVGDVVFENLCVDTDLCIQTGQGLRICECSATYGSSSCQCTPCTLDNGLTGVTLDCVDVGTPLCIPLSFPQATSETNSVQPFIPLLTIPEN